MFEKENNNLFVSRMMDFMNEAIGGWTSQRPCADEIRPMIKDFFRKSIENEFECSESDVYWSIQYIGEIVIYLARNTRNYEKLKMEEVKSIKKIFDELYELYAETIGHYSNPRETDHRVIKRKIRCISKIVLENMLGMHDSKKEHHNYRDGMIFQNYENLWKIIHRVNHEWNELCDRGFSLKVFDDYRGFFEYDRVRGLEKSEEEKFETFMAILDGKKKFIPVYEYRPICFKVVSNDCTEEVVETIENRYSRSYRMRQYGEDKNV